MVLKLKGKDLGEVSFENDVKIYGIKTNDGDISFLTSLRMM